MKQFMKSINASVITFMQEEQGSQVVEYALIVAAVSVALIGVLTSTTNGFGSSFTTLLSRVTKCFTVGSTCA